MKYRYWLVTVLLLSVIALPAKAQRIDYDATERVLHVSGFAEEAPATLGHVLEADQNAGWGVVDYDGGTQIYTVRASLHIGSDDDNGTFFQVGIPARPRETLVLHGNLVVTPPRPTGRRVEHWSDYAGERYDGRYRVSNRLTLGCPRDPEIRPTVKIACATRNEYGIEIRSDPVPADTQERWYVPIGEFHMFNAVLTAATPAPEHAYRAAITLAHAGVNYVLRNSEISWWSGELFRTVFIATRHMTGEDRTVRGMRFLHGGTAHGPFQAVDCEFRHLDVARIDQGALRGTFRDNRENIRLTTMHTGPILTDCDLGPTRQPLLVPRSARDENWLRNYSAYRHSSDMALVVNPGLIERVSLVVQVLDAQDRPVPRAAVLVDCPADPENLSVVRNLAVTDRAGLTSDDAEGRALVVSRRELRPTDDPAAPEEVTFVYRVRVRAPGLAPFEQMLDSAQPIPRPLVVRLSP